MLCDDCRMNEATFHSIRKINGLKTETHLCAECQQKRGYDEMPLSGLGDILGSFGDFMDAPAGRITCEHCGTTADDFLSTGFLGCERCYERFSRAILPRLQQLQQKTQHVGKVPGRQSEQSFSDYSRLKAELDRAIEAEDFEKAGRINDQLKRLKENG